MRDSERHTVLGNHDPKKLLYREGIGCIVLFLLGVINVAISGGITLVIFMKSCDSRGFHDAESVLLFFLEPRWFIIWILIFCVLFLTGGGFWHVFVGKHQKSQMEHSEEESP